MILHNKRSAILKLDQPQPAKRMQQAILLYIICDQIRHFTDLIATIAHCDPVCAVFQHRNIYFRIAKGNGICPVSVQMVQQRINRMGFGDILDAQITKQRTFSASPPQVPAFKSGNAAAASS